jgi:hypothetical protein
MTVASRFFLLKNAGPSGFDAVVDSGYGTIHTP